MDTSLDSTSTPTLDPDLLALQDRAPAAVWRRVAARVMDAAAVITAMWTLIVLHVFWFMGSLSARLDPEPWGRSFVPILTFVVMYAAYEGIFLVRSHGQTPGKDIFNVRVVPIHGGDAISAGRALRRWAIPGLLALVWPLWIAVLGLAAMSIPIAFGARRAIHDLIAGTTVVPYRRDDEDPAAKRPVGRRHRRRLRRLAEDAELLPALDRENQ